MCFNPESFNTINIVMDAGRSDRAHAQGTQERSTLHLRPKNRVIKEYYKKLVSLKYGGMYNWTKIIPFCTGIQVHCSTNYCQDLQMH